MAAEIKKVGVVGCGLMGHGIVQGSASKFCGNVVELHEFPAGHPLALA